MVATPDEWNQFYRNLGSALSQWQSVEHALFDVFHKVSKCPNRHVASAMFFAIMNFEGKVTMTNMGAQIALADTPFLSEWVKLFDRVQTNQTLRNHLAHFQINEDSSRNERAKYRLRLTPNFVNASQSVRYAEDTAPAYDLSQINGFADQFSVLATDLTAFAERLS
jgi:hypothetical protein